MKLILKKALSLVVSIFNLFTWFVRLITNENLKNYILKKQQTNPIIILGNGPSLVNLINTPNFIEARKNNHFCTVNFSILSPFFHQIKPEYLTVVDPLFFQRPIKNESVKLFKEELNNINWNMSLIIPIKYYEQMKEELIYHSYVKVIPIHTNTLDKSIKSKSIRNFIYKKGLSCPRIQNVVVASIYSMMNYGYTQIYLYGVEHSWTTQLCVNKDNQVCLKDIHFYDKDNVELKPYLKSSGEEYKMHEILRDFAHMFDSYHELQTYADYLGDVFIINKSKDSFIDAFKKI